MVAFCGLLLALSASAVPEGDSSLRLRLQDGDVTRVGRSVRTGENSFVEATHRGALIWQFSRSELEVTDSGLKIRRGRVRFATAGTAVPIRVQERAAVLSPAAEVLVSLGPEPWMAVQQGIVRIETWLSPSSEDSVLQIVKAGQLIQLGTEPRVVSGGLAQHRLAREEGLKRFLGKLGGDALMRELLLAAVPGGDVPSLPVARSRNQNLLRAHPEDLLEDALRPPPFFESEVPPRGPNVQVEVDFGE